MRSRFPVVLIASVLLALPAAAFDFNDLDRNDGRFDPKNIVHNQSNEDYDQSVKLSPVMDRQRQVNSKSMHEKKGKNKIRKETGKF